MSAKCLLQMEKISVKLRKSSRAISWKRRTWPTGSLFFGFDCDTWLQWIRYWTELSSWIISAEICGSHAERNNPWMDRSGWLKRTDVGFPVSFGNLTLQSVMYEILVTGYGNRTNKLQLFDIDSVDESIVQDGISFDKKEIAKNLTLFLYPDDSDENGRLLRIYQQYFMVSNGAQLILKECEARGCNLYDLPDYAVIQINDTHPTMIIRS